MFATPMYLVPNFLNLLQKNFFSKRFVG